MRFCRIQFQKVHMSFVVLSLLPRCPVRRAEAMTRTSMFSLLLSRLLRPVEEPWSIDEHTANGLVHGHDRGDAPRELLQA